MVVPTDFHPFRQHVIERVKIHKIKDWWYLHSLQDRNTLWRFSIAIIGNSSYETWMETQRIYTVYIVLIYLYCFVNLSRCEYLNKVVNLFVS